MLDLHCISVEYIASSSASLSSCRFTYWVWIAPMSYSFPFLLRHLSSLLSLLIQSCKLLASLLCIVCDQPLALQLFSSSLLSSFLCLSPPNICLCPSQQYYKRVSPLVPQEASPFTNSCNAECPYTWLTSIWTSPRLSSRRSKIGQSAMRDFSFADMCRHQWSSSPTYWGQRPERGGMDDGGKAGLFEGMKGRVYWSVVWHAVCRFWS